MTTTQGVWMTRRAYIRLQAELAGLRSQPAIEVPDDFMDYDNNVVAAYQARQARIGQIHDMLANAIVGEDPPDDGVAEPGMVLTVRYDDTGDTETFLWVCVAPKTPTSRCTPRNRRWAAPSSGHAPANSALTRFRARTTCL